MNIFELKNLSKNSSVGVFKTFEGARLAVPKQDSFEILRRPLGKISAGTVVWRMIRDDEGRVREVDLRDSEIYF